MANNPAGTSVIALPPEEDLGPCMRVLTDGQKRFVIALVGMGGQNATDAAIWAGMGATKESSQVYGSRSMHNPKVVAAIREEADRRLRSGAILAASALVEIAGNMQHKDRFKASVELLNRAGLMTETVSRHIIEDHRGDNELVDMIRAMAMKNGINPATLLGKSDGDVVDAEFTEVGSMEGLEDLL